MTLRLSACGCVLLGAVGCIPYVDFTPCEETGTCNRFDATERGELGDLAMEPPGDAADDALDAGDVAAMDAPDGDADVSEDDGASVVDAAGDAPEDVVCAAGAADCDGLPSNGCEADTRTSAMHCGACGAACAAPEHGAARCAAGRCEVTCDAGHMRAGEGCAAIVAPRLVAPLSPHTVTSQTPRLRWALGAGTDGARVELCRERACATVVHRFDAMGASVVTPVALTPGAWFWRAAGMQGAAAGVAYSATWELFVGHRSAPVNTAWGQTTDLNGDGYADLVFAAGSTVYVHAGSPRGLATTPTTLTPAPGQEVRGLSARGGDVDGDGFGDLLMHVAPPGEVLGVALLYRGGAGGVGGTAARTYDPATSRPTLLGDVDGDGYGDLGLSDSILFGTSGGPPDMRTAPPRNDRVTVPADDVNGDGYADTFLCTFVRLRATCIAQTGSPLGARGTFGPALDVTGGPRTLFDPDGDGCADFAVLLPAGAPPGQWTWYGGLAAPSLQLVSETSALVDVGVGDNDRDGLSDSALTALDGSGMFAGAYVVRGDLARRWDDRRALYASAGFPLTSSLLHFPVGDTDGDGVDEFAGVDAARRTLHIFGASATTLGLPVRSLPFPGAAATLVYSR